MLPKGASPLSLCAIGIENLRLGIEMRPVNGYNARERPPVSSQLRIKKELTK